MKWIWKWVFVGLGLFCGACGKIPWLKTDAQLSTEESIATGEGESQGSLSWSLDPPVALGGDWSRRFRLRLEDSSLWSVEKRWDPKGEWRGVGFTDGRGEFLDEQVGESTQYRFGKVVESPWFTGVADRRLSGKLCSEHRDLRVEAYRVYVPAGEGAILENCNLDIRAEILQIDGELRSFSEDSLEGRDAGLLSLQAATIQGSGHIRWIGESGTPGKDGANGRDGFDGDRNSGTLRGSDGITGGDGGDGGNGGKGGRILMRVGSGLVPSDVSGGKAGDAGRAGIGGRGGVGVCGYSEVADARSCGVSGHKGTDGRRGKKGVDGASGSVTSI